MIWCDQKIIRDKVSAEGEDCLQRIKGAKTRCKDNLPLDHQYIFSGAVNDEFSSNLIFFYFSPPDSPTQHVSRPLKTISSNIQR